MWEQGTHADGADKADFATWAQFPADGTRKLVDDDADVLLHEI